MELGIHFANFTLPGGARSARADPGGDRADARRRAGAASFTLMDHWFQMEAVRHRARTRCSRATPSLGFLAGQTQRMTLGLLVTGVTYRHPGLLAKIVTTLDVLSGGRAMLGIGAAWYEREHQGLGVPFPPVAERFERLEETLQICLQMWSDDDGPYEGMHYQLAETHLRAAADPAAPAADPDRRQRRAQDAAAGRPVRRRLQPVRHRHRTRSPHKLEVLAATARTRAATPPRSARPSSRSATRRPTPTRSSGLWSRWRPSASTSSRSCRSTPDPVAYAASLGPVVERLADL